VGNTGEWTAAKPILREGRRIKVGATRLPENRSCLVRQEVDDGSQKSGSVRLLPGMGKPLALETIAEVQAQTERIIAPSIKTEESSFKQLKAWTGKEL